MAVYLLGAIELAIIGLLNTWLEWSKWSLTVFLEDLGNCKFSCHLQSILKINNTSTAVVDSSDLGGWFKNTFPSIQLALTTLPTNNSFRQLCTQCNNSKTFYCSKNVFHSNVNARRCVNNCLAAFTHLQPPPPSMWGHHLKVPVIEKGKEVWVWCQIIIYYIYLIK